MDELIKNIKKLRQEGVPLHFRRKKLDGKTVITIWYGYKIIILRANPKDAAIALNAARWVHHAHVNP
jgi:hypothetical protein